MSCRYCRSSSVIARLPLKRLKRLLVAAQRVAVGAGRARVVAGLRQVGHSFCPSTGQVEVLSQRLDACVVLVLKRLGRAQMQRLARIGIEMIVHHLAQQVVLEVVASAILSQKLAAQQLIGDDGLRTEGGSVLVVCIRMNGRVVVGSHAGPNRGREGLAEHSGGG